MTTPRSSLHSYPLNQPNIDLQINLRQLWAGCNTLLIDVRPHWLLDNQCGVDLSLVGREKGTAKGEKHWRMPKEQVFAPPTMEVYVLIDEEIVVFLKK